ncbi:hypothetical protein DL98DRAFT_522433 [Cadophora sp. DSE1049]|nr:hypothetical protein DL98DRAFT_522433 [Cadophora sp. DSE1049]
MTVTMSEPRPLNYDASSLRSSTECHLRLEFSPIGSEDIHHGFQAMKFSIYSLIRVKTFYSVKSFARLPNQTLASDGGKTGLRNELVKLGTREIPHVAWAYNFSRDSASPRTSRGSSTDSIINENGAGPSSGPANPPQSPSGKWTANLTHPICMEGQLPPTFCCSIAARLYTVILRLKVSGIRRESFNLEVPLQVVHTASDRISEEETVMAGQTGEDPISLGFRRASEASWFSDESLDGPNLPPHYHP